MALGDFSEQAAAYRGSRPSYPAELVDDLLDEWDIVAGDQVVDLGAGTGIFTELLLERDLRVTSIEPNTPMREFGQEQCPGATWVDATFEATGLPDRSQKWAFAAQAFHWADVPRGLAEIRRILVPGGGFTALWNQRDNDRSEVLGWVQEAISRHVPGFDHDYRCRDWEAELLLTGDFSAATLRRLDHTVRMTTDRCCILRRSNHQLATAAGPQHLQAFLDDLEQYLKTKQFDAIDVPYICHAWTAT